MTPADEDKLKKLEEKHFIEQYLNCFYASASVTQASTLDFNQNNSWNGEQEAILTFVLLLMLSGTLKKKFGKQHEWLKRFDQEFEKHLKGFRDVNRVALLTNLSISHKDLSLQSGLLVMGFGVLYTRLMIHNENTRKAQKDNIKDNQRSASNLLQQLARGSSQCTSEEIKIKQIADSTTQRKRLLLNGTEGFFLGNYFAASWLQIVQFLALIVPKINPNPVYFAIAGTILGLGFMAQKVCDQKCLDLQEEISVLHCEVGKDLLQFKQTKQGVKQVEQQLATAPENKNNNTAELKRSLVRLTQQRHQLQTTLLSKKNTLLTKQKQLHSWTRYSSNVTQVTNTITRIIKNDIVAITAMLAGPGIKLALGVTFLSACGGPIGLALLGAVLICLLVYALYKQYQKHKLKQAHHQITKDRGMELYGLIKPKLPSYQRPQIILPTTILQFNPV